MSMPMPVGVSGPGALSQRTDVQPMSVPTGMPYGQAGAMAQAEQAAPMAGTPGLPAAAVQAIAGAAPGGPPPPSPPPTLDQPTQRPNEPVTAGAASGPGPGPAVLNATPGAPQAGGRLSQTIFQAAAADPSGMLSQLGALAQQRGL
jgi:hypothetical protein